MTETQPHYEATLAERLRASMTCKCCGKQLYNATTVANYTNLSRRTIHRLLAGLPSNPATKAALEDWFAFTEATGTA